jgi:hypothetical protein
VRMGVIFSYLHVSYLSHGSSIENVTYREFVELAKVRNPLTYLT